MRKSELGPISWWIVQAPFKLALNKLRESWLSCEMREIVLDTETTGLDMAADRIIEINALNPQVAARVARCFDRWKKFDAGRQAHAQAALERIRDAPGLSRDVAEIITKALA